MQSIIVAKNSVDENRGFNSNLFYGIFMVGNVFGNLFAYLLLDVFNVVCRLLHIFSLTYSHV